MTTAIGDFSPLKGEPSCHRSRKNRATTFILLLWRKAGMIQGWVGSQVHRCGLRGRIGSLSFRGGERPPFVAALALA